jgi:alpha-L-arabinofuranosidase
VDSLNVMPTPNYFVQQMFAKNRGDETVPLEISGVEKGNSLFASAVKDDAGGEIVLKLVNTGDEAETVAVNFAGLPQGTFKAKQIVLAGKSKDGVNTIGEPLKLKPAESDIELSAVNSALSLPPRSFTVLRIKQP